MATRRSCAGSESSLRYDCLVNKRNECSTFLKSHKSLVTGPAAILSSLDCLHERGLFFA